MVPVSDLMEFIKAEWADIHHSRNQEWTILAMIGVSFYFLSQAEDLAQKGAAIGFGIGACIVGIFISMRHWALLLSKIKVINICERKLGIKVVYPQFPISVQGMIIMLYFVIISVLSGFLVWFLLEKWIFLVRVYVSLVVGFLVILIGIKTYKFSYSLAKKKRDETDVIFSFPGAINRYR